MENITKIFKLASYFSGMDIKLLDAREAIEILAKELKLNIGR